MSFILHDARQTMSVFASEFTDNIGAIFASLGIALGGLVAGWIMIKIGECITGASSSKRWKYDPTKIEADRWKQESGKSRNSVARLITMFLAILVTTSGLWVAAQTAGFNFWTVVLGYGILSLVGTYAFGGMLTDIGAFFLVSLTDKIEEGYWIEVHGMGIQGRVTAIHWLWVEMEYVDPKTNVLEEIQIPTGVIMRNVIKRVFSKEIHVDNIVAKDPDNYQSTKHRVNHRLKNKVVVDV